MSDRLRHRSFLRIWTAMARVDERTFIRAASSLKFRRQEKTEGPQLALEPLDGQGIAGFVPQPLALGRILDQIMPTTSAGQWPAGNHLTCCRRARCAR